MTLTTLSLRDYRSAIYIMNESKWTPIVMAHYVCLLNLIKNFKKKEEKKKKISVSCL